MAERIFKWMFFTDPHVKDTPPISRSDDYASAILGKIEKIRDMCVDQKVDGVFVGGDVFDVKNSARTTHGLVVRCINLFSSFPCPVYTLVGNHDIFHDQLSTLDKQPLGVVFAKGDAVLIRLSENSFQAGPVRFVGYDYQIPEKIDVSHFDRPKDGEDVQIAFTHHNLVPSGTKFWDEAAIPYGDFKDISPDIVINGHLHSPPGGNIVVKDGKTFVNPGALSRGSLTIDDVKRPVQALIIEYPDRSGIGVEHVTLTLVDLEATPAEEVFYIERKERELENSQKMAEFVENLTDTIENSSERDTVQLLEEIEMSSEVRASVEKYLNRAKEKMQRAA